MPKRLSTVLIVDDNPLNLKLLSSVLEAENIRIVKAQDGIEALEVLDKEEVDIIVSDILMPRMDGYQLCLEVRKQPRLRNIPFIHFTSTYTSASGEKTAYDMGSTLFLRKPEQLTKVVEAVNNFINQPNSQYIAPETTISEAVVLREYNEVLIDKLEKRARELELRTNELERAQEKMLLLMWSFERSSDGLILTDIEGNITMANDAFCEMFEYDREEIIGQRTTFLKSESSTPELAMQIWNALETHGEWKGEVVNRTQSGKEIECFLIISPISDTSGQRVGYLWLESDLTNRKKLERQIAHSEQLAAIGEAVSTLAHEIRNPLNGISMNASMLGMLKPGVLWTDEESESVSLIKRECSRLQDLVNTVLGYARKQVPTYERISVSELVSEVIELLRYQAMEQGVTITAIGLEHPKSIRCDPAMIKQVLLNLLQNGIEEAAASEVDDKEVLLEYGERVASEEPAGMSGVVFTFDIYNTGRVLSKEDQARLFEPFFTKKTRGLGLGLATSLKIVRQHSGTIHIESPVKSIHPHVTRFATFFRVQMPI